MTAPSVSSAFVDLATYGELEKRMYSVNNVRYSRERYYRKDMIIIILIIIVLFYLKKK
jgi:hypothetical protein